MSVAILSVACVVDLVAVCCPSHFIAVPASSRP